MMATFCLCSSASNLCLFMIVCWVLDFNLHDSSKNPCSINQTCLNSQVSCFQIATEAQDADFLLLVCLTNLADYYMLIYSHCWSWWSQWEVMAASPCHSWWCLDSLWVKLIRLWPHSFFLCYSFCWSDTTVTFKVLLWSLLCHLIDMPHWNLLQLSNYLRDQGVKKGDAVAIYMPMLVELPIAMLACARIGAVHSVRICSFVARHCCFWHDVITLSACHHVEV